MAVETLLCILNNMPEREREREREGGRERVIQHGALVLVLCAYHMW